MNEPWRERPRAMLEIDRPERTIDPDVLRAPGGFAWWYAEVSDPAGNGVVLIWSFGLPFLPGYQAAALAGEAPAARQRPSLNVAAYERGEPVCYVLREFDADAASWEAGSDGETWRFGASRLQTRRPSKGPVQLEAELDLPIAGGGRLQATFRLEGPAGRWAGPVRGVEGAGAVAGMAADDAPGHRWTPVCGAAFATARVRCGDLRLAVSGRAYHDRNAAPWPLADLGIDRWLWGRAALPDRDRVFYALWPETEDADAAPLVLGYELHADGRLEAVADLTMVTHGPHRTRWRMPSAHGFSLCGEDGAPFLELRARHAVDDGPFYLRRLCDATVDSRPVGHGTFESIVPRRIDLALHRPLVRMRVGRNDGGDSFWLPLFEGSKFDRLRRLLRLPNSTTEAA